MADMTRAPEGSSLADTVNLIGRAQKGDHAAYERIFRRYYPRVLRIARCRMGNLLRRFEDPEDIVQNTFKEAVRILERFDVRHEAALINLFASMVQHQIQNAARHHRAQKRDRKRELPLHPPGASTTGPRRPVDPALSQTSIGGRLARAEQLSIVDGCIGELRREHREVIILRDIEGGAWDWIADELGRPSPGAARELHTRAIDALRRIAIPRLGPQ